MRPWSFRSKLLNEGGRFCHPLFSRPRHRVAHDDNQLFPACPSGRCLAPARRADVERRRQPALIVRCRRGHSQGADRGRQIQRGPDPVAALGAGPQRRRGRAVPHRYRCDRCIAAAWRFRRSAGYAAGRGHRVPAHHFDQSSGPCACAPGAGPGVLSQGRGQPGARPLRAGAGGQTATSGSGQCATVPGRDPRAPTLDDVSRRCNVAGQQHRRGLGRADHLYPDSPQTRKSSGNPAADRFFSRS